MRRNSEVGEIKKTPTSEGRRQMRSDRHLILNSGAHLQPAARERMVMMMPVMSGRGSHDALSKLKKRTGVKRRGCR